MLLRKFNLDALWASVVNATPWPLYPRETGLVPIIQGVGWALRPVWTGVRKRKFLAHAWIQTPNRPARSESLY
jgi:hypothetical protein